MKPMTKAVLVVLIQVLIVCSLGAKLLFDRETCPQAWFKTQRYDPNLPIRGRYVSLQIEVTDPRTPEEIQQKFGNELQMYQNQRAPAPNFFSYGRECGSIVVPSVIPIAAFDNSAVWDCDNLTFEHRRNGDQTVLRLSEPILFFISDTAKDPTRLATGDELWVLATIPRKGPPRPLRLGVKKAGGKDIVPLQLD